ncbi:MAG: dUTP diphosphatase [Firmicutes bacterium]|nr:dUTP diphosphatase [Bacillota bacterium]
MKKVKIPLRRLPHAAGLPLPQYMTAGAAGMDLLAAVEGEITIRPGGFLPIPTGLQMALPEGYEGQIRPRSGLAARFGVTVLNAPGTIDSDYRGEVQVILVNHGPADFPVRRGDRIAQLVVAEVVRGEWQEVTGDLTATARGEGGFGHTGV